MLNVFFIYSFDSISDLWLWNYGRQWKKHKIFRVFDILSLVNTIFESILLLISDLFSLSHSIAHCNYFQTKPSGNQLKTIFWLMVFNQISIQKRKKCAKYIVYEFSKTFQYIQFMALQRKHLPLKTLNSKLTERLNARRTSNKSENHK